LDFTLHWEDLNFLLVTLNVENSRGFEFVFYVEGAIFSLQADMHVTEVKLSVEETALSLSH